jgi:hypothetical protein
MFLTNISAFSEMGSDSNHISSAAASGVLESLDPRKIEISPMHYLERYLMTFYRISCSSGPRPAQVLEAWSSLYDAVDRASPKY